VHLIGQLYNFVVSARVNVARLHIIVKKACGAQLLDFGLDHLFKLCAYESR
jgi:hypothetical protein